uniref:High mobility group protein B2 n=3 Tax=Ornithorhynchus anatinus TaxID=9258 RepID=A0A6I8NSF6_ORNAN
MLGGGAHARGSGPIRGRGGRGGARPPSRPMGRVGGRGRRETQQVAVTGRGGGGGGRRGPNKSVRSGPDARQFAAGAPRDRSPARRDQPPHTFTLPRPGSERGAFLSISLSFLPSFRPSAATAMGKGDPNKPRGKMSSYAFFVQTCREEHKKKHPDSLVNFADFSRKCSERWKTMAPKEKAKFEDLAKGDKARYDREMKNYVPPKGEKKGKKKDPNAPKRPPSAFFLFCSEQRPKIKSEHPGLSIGDTAKKLGELWSEQSAKDKLPYEQKAAKLKEKYEKDIAAYRAKGDVGKKGPGRPTGSKKKAEPEEEEDEDDDEEDEDEDEEGSEENRIYKIFLKKVNSR